MPPDPKPLTPAQKASATRKKNEHDRKEAATQAAAEDLHSYLLGGGMVIYGYDKKHGTGWHRDDGTLVLRAAIYRLVQQKRAKEEGNNRVVWSNPTEYAHREKKRSEKNAANEVAWLNYWRERLNAAIGTQKQLMILREFHEWGHAHGLTDDFPHGEFMP